jgi:hypothetical protein
MSHLLQPSPVLNRLQLHHPVLYSIPGKSYHYNIDSVENEVVDGTNHTIE